MQTFALIAKIDKNHQYQKDLSAFNKYFLYQE